MDSEPVVIAIRRDAENEFRVFAGTGSPVVLDVDLDASFDGALTETKFTAWKAGMLTSYDDCGLSREHPAFAAYEDAVDSVLYSR